MSKQTNTNTPKKINWSAVKTNVIIAFIFTSLGIVLGYFGSISIINDTQATAIETINQAAQVVKQVASPNVK